MNAEERAWRPRERPRSSGETRGQSQRDHDRILYATEFRRLAGVTQVVLAGEGHLFHNRLTHSLKVAQVGRTLAEKIRRSLRSRPAKNAVEELGGLDPIVVEAAGLAHDLGHPPFGHIAEDELDKLSRAAKLEKSDAALSDGFEGNAQSFRIVARLARISDEFGGLNLTRATLNAILKYPWPWEDLGTPPLPKWGVFDTDKELLLKVRETYRGGARQQCLEAQLMDWSDDISYAVHDVEDFYRAGFIPMERLAPLRPNHDERDDIIERTKRSWLRQAAAARWARGDAQTPFEERAEDSPHEDAFGDAYAATIARFPNIGQYVGTSSQRARLRRYSSNAIDRYVGSTSFSQDNGAWGLQIPPQYRLEVTLLKELTTAYVTENPSLVTQQHGQKTIVRELFNIYMRAAAHREPEVFPASAQEEVPAIFERIADSPQDVTRFVCDIIASMTERQAVVMHRRLTGTDLGSVFDPTVF